MRKLFQRLSRPSRNTYFTRREIRFLSDMTAAMFPGQAAWSQVKYPGALTLPVHLMPMPERFPEELFAPIEALHRTMRESGVQHNYTETSSQQDYRQGHLWLVTIGLGKYLPIGQSTFLAEKLRADNILGAGSFQNGGCCTPGYSPPTGSRKYFDRA